ncbi:MAG: hypothetical protein R3E89_09270 [Thiolinea sp.]
MSVTSCNVSAILYAYPDPDFIFPAIEQAITELTGILTPAQTSRLLGIGIATPYGLGGWQQEADIPEHITQRWNQIDIKESVQSTQHYPVWLVNDATAACIASLEFGNPGALQQLPAYFRRYLYRWWHHHEPYPVLRYLQ